MAITNNGLESWTFILLIFLLITAARLKSVHIDFKE